MKIGIEAQRLFRPDKHGMEIVTQELINYLQKIDLLNEYVLFIKEDTDQTISETNNFKIKYLTGSYPVWEQVKLPTVAKKEKIDFLHCTSNTGPIFSKIPVLLTLHDIIYLENLNFKGSPYQNFGNIYRRIVVPEILKQCKFILTVSEYEKQIISERFPSFSDRVQVVYNGVNPIFREINDSVKLEGIRKKYNLPEQFFLFFGNTAPKKNTERLLLAYADAYFTNKSIPTLVVTDYEIGLVKKVLEQSKYKGVINSIFVLDHIAHEDMPYFYNLAKLFLYPSLRESFGMPILEAMACGTPVITSNTSSMPEVAGGAAELIDPLNQLSITEAILKLNNSTEIYIQKVKAGLARSALFNWENTARSVLSFYNKMNNL